MVRLLKEHLLIASICGNLRVCRALSRQDREKKINSLLLYDDFQVSSEWLLHPWQTMPHCYTSVYKIRPAEFVGVPYRESEKLRNKFDLKTNNRFRSPWKFILVSSKEVCALEVTLFVTLGN